MSFWPQCPLELMEVDMANLTSLDISSTTTLTSDFVAVTPESAGLMAGMSAGAEQLLSNGIITDHSKIINITNQYNNMVVNYDYFGLKTVLVIMDCIGLIMNMLGVDMLWHGVEINHAVYALLLQDVVLALMTTSISLIFCGSLWYHDEMWFQMHVIFTLISLIFQDWCWGSVAYLRFLNITKNEIWLDLDQESLKRRVSWMTWCAVAVNSSLMLPFLFIETWELLPRNLSILSLGLMTATGLLLISFLFATYFYVKIYLFARIQAEENEQFAAQAAAAAATNRAAVAAHAQQPVVGSHSSGQHISSGNHHHHNNHATYHNPFDDSSDDDDLIDPSETPSAKQSSAVVQALKTMLMLVLIHLICIGILSLDESNTWKYAVVTTLLSLVRFPGKLIICVLNFRPIRNTVALYLENLPAHFHNLMESVMEYCRFKWRSPIDDQRNVIVSNDERNSPVINEDSCLNIVGRRESAVSPANSHDSLQLPVVQC